MDLYIGTATTIGPKKYFKKRHIEIPIVPVYLTLNPKTFRALELDNIRLKSHVHCNVVWYECFGKLSPQFPYLVHNAGKRK